VSLFYIVFEIFDFFLFWYFVYFFFATLMKNGKCLVFRKNVIKITIQRLEFLDCMRLGTAYEKNHQSIDLFKKTYQHF
jgi:hypothetical protein